MNRFILKITPVSHFAFFCFGALAMAPVLRYSLPKIGWIIPTALWLTLLIVLSIKAKKRILWAALGVFFIIGQEYLIAFVFPSMIHPHFTIQEWKNTPKNQIVHIKPGRELKKGYREVDIQIGTVHKKAVWKEQNNRQVEIPTLLCKADLIRLRIPPIKMKDYYQFLSTYGDYYLQADEYRCHTEKSVLDQKRLIRKKTRILLERGGIYDHANDISMGLIFGDSGYLHYDFKQKAREGGILHLFAASGLHIGIIIGFLLLFFQKIGIFNYYMARILPMVFAFFYLYVLSFPVSLTRAYCFAGLMVLALLFFRKTRAIDVILISAFLIYVFSPENYMSISFLLSFGAVIAILFFKEHFDYLYFPGWKHILKDSFTLSLCASLGTFPVLLYFFQSFSFGSLLINLVLVPLTSILLPFLYTSVLLETLSIAYLKDIFWSYTELFLRLLARLTDELSWLGFYKETGSFSYYNLYLYLAFITLLAILIIFNYYIQNKEKEIEPKDKKSMLEKRKLKKRNLCIHIFCSILAITATITFYVMGYFTMKAIEYQTKDVYTGSDFFLIRNTKKIYIGGNCKYGRYKIYKIFSQGFCLKQVKSIIVESERCLQLAHRCLKKQKQAKIEIADNWNKHWLQDNRPIFDRSRKQRKFLTHSGRQLLFFYPDKDPLSILRTETKDGKGSIILLFPYLSKDKASDWNESKEYLGVSKYWKFIGRNDI